jgi:hypothetical protein
MSRIRRWIFEWLRGNRGVALYADEHHVEKTMPNVRVGTLAAMNGKLLEVSAYKKNPNGPDWTSEYYIIAEGQTLTEAIALVMVMKGLEK